MPVVNNVFDRKQNAIQDFYELRRKADLEILIGNLKGESTDLLAYEEVRRKLRPIESARRILEDIPIEKIVGSVNRTTDFSRTFLPRVSTDAYRWATVREGVESMEGLPPIETYRVGDVYFILDGHHRVSVARELGAKSIQGYVIPVYTRVPLSPDDSPDDLIIKSEYTDFLSDTHIDDIRPDANLMVSVPGQYKILQEHINVHRYFMGIEQKREINEKEAIIDWYDNVYSPVTQVIRARNMLRDFPQRTETDLYLWIMENRVTLSGGSFGWEVSVNKVASVLTNRYGQTPERKKTRISKKIINSILPKTLEPVSPTGIWRSERQTPHRRDRLFDDILVTVIGDHSDQPAINIALDIARRESARLLGVHVVGEEHEKVSPDVHRIQTDFENLCDAAEVTGRLVVEVGQASSIISQRSGWVDLSIFRLAYPPSNKMMVRLKSGVRQLIRSCISPVFAVPDAAFHLNNPLLAYGPGPNSDEALYVAAYVACAWSMPLTVVSVSSKNSGETAGIANIDKARIYLESHDVSASYVVEEAQYAASAILLTAEKYNSGFIITGSYEGPTLREAVLGSTVDKVLRSTRRPVLICR